MQTAMSACATCSIVFIVASPHKLPMVSDSKIYGMKTPSMIMNGSKRMKRSTIAIIHDWRIDSCASSVVPSPVNVQPAPTPRVLGPSMRMRPDLSLPLVSYGHNHVACAPYEMKRTMKAEKHPQLTVQPKRTVAS